MRRRAVSILALAAVLAAIGIPSVVARQRAVEPARWEYLRIALVQSGDPFTAVQPAYQACRAGSAEWRCREFVVADDPDDALRQAFVTAGFEGWELVTVVEGATAGFPQSPGYLFKRELLH